MAVPWVRFTENALVPKIMLQFQNGDTSWHQGDSAGIFMYSAGIFETFVKKILCPRASPMCTADMTCVKSYYEDKCITLTWRVSFEHSKLHNNIFLGTPASDK